MACGHFVNGHFVNECFVDHVIKWTFHRPGRFVDPVMKWAFRQLQPLVF